MTAEFDHQWAQYPSPYLEHDGGRVNELLAFTGLDATFFCGKRCLDCGCGSGRYSYALQRLGAFVDSFDISPVAVEMCKRVIPGAQIMDLMELEASGIYDFVLCWGVLHHLPQPRLGFSRVAGQVRPGGRLHVMIYGEKEQKRYGGLRDQWRRLREEERPGFLARLVAQRGGDLHGWHDAVNPCYNWGYSERQVRQWFKEEGFAGVRRFGAGNLNMNGVKDR